MAKKRKSRASEPEPSIKAPEVQQPEPEEQPPVEEPVQHIEEQAPAIEEQADPEQEQPEDMDDDQKEEEQEEEGGEEEGGEEEGEEEENETEAVNASNDDPSVQQEQPETNGGDKSNNMDEEEEVFEEEPAEKLLEPFSKEQLAVLLKEAISKHPEIIESVHKLADADPARRKIFVHGLGWDTTAETLVSEFGKYGEIEDCKAVVDKVSGKSKGYGFILFKHRSGAQRALKEPQKKIGTRMTSCQLASAGPIPAPPPTAAPVSEYTQRKIFVSNVSADIDVPKLVEFFSKFGEIEDGPLGLDKQTGKPKGFALFVYKSVESARKALEEPHKTFDGHTLHCQRAIDGPKNSKPFFQGHHHHQQQHHHHHQPYHHHNKKSKYSGGGGGGGSGHLMAPSGPSAGYNPAAAAANPALTPALGQALTALLATQGAGLGIGNLLGGLGAPVNQGMPPVMNNSGYGNQGGGYGNQGGMQGGYQNPQMGQGGGRPPQGGGAYMGHGH